MTEPMKSGGELHLVTPKQRRQVQKRAHAKVEELCVRLRALATELGSGSQLPTTRELCLLLNTSSATLTSALDQLETEQLFYRKERQGVFVSEIIHQKIIHIIYNALFTNHSQSPFWSLLWSFLIKEAEYRSTFKNELYQFHFLHHPFTQTLPEDYLTFLSSAQAQGCIIVGANTHAPDHSKLLAIPHVVFAGGGDITIRYDLEGNMLLVMRALLQKHKIACLTPILSPSNIMDLTQEEQSVRYFKQLLTEHGRHIYPELFRNVREHPFADRLTLQEQGYLLTRELFDVPATERPDGIYISDDMMTSGALVAWEELGLQVGQDLQLVSHATPGSPILFGRTKHMTLLEVDPAEVVQAMFSALDAKMTASCYTPEDREIFIRGRLRTGGSS